MTKDVGGQSGWLRSAITLALFALLLLYGAARHDAQRWLIEQRIEDADGASLRSFYQALQQTSKARSPEHAEPNAVTRIVHYGDSHVAADILTGALRRSFQRDFGDAGPGFLFAGKPYAWSARSGVTLNTSAGWRTDGLNTREAGAFGMAGVSFSANTAHEWLRLTARADRFTIFLLKQARGGDVEVLLDGEPYVARLSLKSNAETPDERVFADERTLYLRIAAVDAGEHTLELRTLNNGAVRVLGVVAEQEQAGVTYDALGLNGVRAPRLLNWDWEVVASNLAERRPQLIVIAYGSNEAGDADLNLTLYQRQFAELLRRFRNAAPDASLLVIAPPDRAVFNYAERRWRTLPALPGVVAAQQRAALSEGAAFWNLFEAMGGADSINRWAARAAPLAQKDRVHLTATGYRLVAEALYAELQRGYAEYLAQR